MKKILLIAVVIFKSLSPVTAQSWQLLHHRDNLEFIDLHFINASTGFAFGDSSISGTAITGVVLRTTDGGTSWNTYTLGNSNYSTSKAFVLNANEIFSAGRNGGGNNGLFIKSVDGGATWISPATFGEKLFNVYFLNSSNGWVMGKNGLLARTTDGGATWNPQNISGEDMLSMEFFNDGLTGILGCGGGELYRTTDGGNTWSPVSSNINDGLLNVEIEGNQAWFCGEAGIAIHSTDYGQTWYSQIVPIPVDYGAMSFAGSNGWIGGLAGALNATTDGGSSWVTQPTGNSYEVTGISVPDANHGWYCNTNGDIYKFDNTTALDEHSGSDLRIVVYPNPADDFVMIATGATGNCNYLITDASGKIVIQLDLNETGSHTVNISELPPGFYSVLAVNQNSSKERSGVGFVKK